MGDVLVALVPSVLIGAGVIAALASLIVIVPAARFRRSQTRLTRIRGEASLNRHGRAPHRTTTE